LSAFSENGVAAPAALLRLIPICMFCKAFVWPRGHPPQFGGVVPEFPRPQSRPCQDDGRQDAAIPQGGWAEQERQGYAGLREGNRDAVVTMDCD
ncbi:hypothetical protein, partial [Citrobacter braakii]|uniref:hypothetical protein n=1 Tax=Citrobacter braakii TaxID=57706 RepID=UPI001980DF28